VVIISFTSHISDLVKVHGALGNITSLQGIGQFATRFAAKFVLQKFRKCRGKVAANDIMVYHELLTRLCHDLSACLPRPAEILPRLLPQLCCKNLAHFATIFSGNITANFNQLFTGYFPRHYCAFIANLQRIYRIITTNLLRIFRVFTAI
jgi:hypothetical protein